MKGVIRLNELRIANCELRGVSVFRSLLSYRVVAKSAVTSLCVSASLREIPQLVPHLRNTQYAIRGCAQ